MKRKGLSTKTAKLLRRWAAFRRHSELEVFRVYRNAPAVLQTRMLNDIENMLALEEEKQREELQHWKGCALPENHTGNCSLRDTDAEAKERIGAPGVDRARAFGAAVKGKSCAHGLWSCMACRWTDGHANDGLVALTRHDVREHINECRLPYDHEGKCAT